MFACQHCAVEPEMVVDGAAQLAIVRHAGDCPVLHGQVRTRWPAEPDGYPPTPGQVPFAKRADFGKFGRAIAVRQRGGSEHQRSAL